MATNTVLARAHAEVKASVFDFCQSALRVAVAMVWGGWVLTVLWAWFVVPTFHAPALSVPVAAGLRVMSSFFSAYPADSKERSALDRWTITLLYPLVMLTMGWLVHQFV